MKIAVINFSGNVGKTTVARHLLLPRVEGAGLVAVESLNADDGQGTSQALRGRQFGELQEYLQTIDNIVVDIGASNVEDLVGLMRKYRDSHEDFDYFVVPTVSAFKQQQDTIATLAELAGLGVAASRIKLVFNMVEPGLDIAVAFDTLLSYLDKSEVASASTQCCLSANEIYGRLKALRAGSADRAPDLAAVAADQTDYKALIGKAGNVEEKLALAHALATRRLARGVVPELDACFAALEMEPATT